MKKGDKVWAAERFENLYREDDYDEVVFAGEITSVDTATGFIRLTYGDIGCKVYRDVHVTRVFPTRESALSFLIDEVKEEMKEHQDEMMLLREAESVIDAECADVRSVRKEP